MDRKEEFAEKERRVRGFLKKENLNGLLLTYQRNFSWFTAGGENRVNTAATEGLASILITGDKNYLIANNIETPRLLEEELQEIQLEISQFPWHEETKKKEIINRICPQHLASDDGFNETKRIDISHLQYSLTEREVTRYISLGKEVTAIMTKTCRAIEAGDTEDEIAASLSKNLLEKGIIPTVVLVAADDRIGKFRHPLPQGKKVRNCVMTVLCAKREGLIIAITRIVHFGKIPEALAAKHRAVVSVDSALILNTEIGRLIGDTFKEGINAYKESGFAEEWKNHHQGGPMGYSERYFVATLEENRQTETNEPFGWNPSISGTKSEDTILTTKEGIKVVTEDTNWPLIRIAYRDRTIGRPDILVK